ncbi:helix-turn-helix domain-containing protein [Viridibacillus arvi]|uniref:helix-turn-helix domain-containing protein n=1 Tax=Viridibacillus arvi TaxID=263475 RepID=UPI0034CEEE66
MNSQLTKIEIGQNIRRIRKEKKLTLGQLAKGICSIGKMSNIENGTGILDNITLKEVANRLEVSVDDFRSKNNESAEKFMLCIDEIRKLISLGLLKEAEKKLDLINREFHEFTSSNESFQLRMYYMKALIKKEKKDLHGAFSAFLLVLEIPATTHIDSIFRSKTYHQLGDLHLQSSQDFNKAIYYFEKSLEELLTQNLEVPWKLYYNLTILNMYMHDFVTATIYFNQIRHKNPYLNYLSSLLLLTSGNYKNGMKLLIASKEEFLENRDLEMLIKSTIAYYYFSKFLNDNYKDALQSHLAFSEEILTNMDFKNTLQIEHSMILMQSLTKSFIDIGDLKNSEHCLNLIEDFEIRFDYIDQRYITYTLKALYIKLSDPENISRRKQLLEIALNGMQENTNCTILSPIILKELAILENEENTYSYKALELIEKVSKVQTNTLIQVVHYSPAILSIL